MEHALSRDIQQFLTECIETVSQLELLFLFFENKDITWNAESISRELRNHPAMASKQMEMLESKGILKKDTHANFSYAPVNPTLHETIVKLFALYHERPVSIVTYIFTKPEDKLKGFADAFKFKKD